MNWKFWQPKQRHEEGEVPIKKFSQTDNERSYNNLSIPTRDEALEYVPLFRCVNLLVNQCAELVTNGVKVVDRDGKESKVPTAKNAIKMLKETPNGVQSGEDFIRDIASDYLLDGNALVLVESRRSPDAPGVSQITGIYRLNADTASVVVGDYNQGQMSAAYHVRKYGTSSTIVVPTSRVAHARMMPSGTDSIGGSRQFFSESAMFYLRKALYIGRNSDAWVGSFFDEAAKNNMAIMFPHDVSKAIQERQIKAYERTLTDKRAPLLLFAGATATMLNPTPQDADANKLREYGVQEIARFYGVPAPLVGLQVTQWGSGIEQLSRLHYRYAARLHLGVILNALSLRMLPSGLKFEIDISSEVRGDFASMATFAAQIRPTPNGPGIASREETRRIMGLVGDYNDDWDFDPYAGKGKVDTDEEGRIKVK